MEFGKKCLIIGSSNVIHYKQIFPLIKANMLWLGVKSGDMAFKVPDDYEERETRYWKDENGQKWRSLGNICWFTNLDHNKRHEELDLVCRYFSEDYPTYDNYDAIDVGRVQDIPFDYDGVMGVPDTILGQYNPDQFEIIGLGCGDLGKQIGVGKNYRGRTDLAYTKDGKHKCPYSRILIRNKHPQVKK